MNEKLIKKAAGAIYRYRNGPDYWTYLVFLQSFPPWQNLHLSVQDSYRVFQALESKGFIKKLDGQFLEAGQFLEVENIKLQKYEIDWGKISDFKEYSTIPFLHKFLPDCVIGFLTFWHTLLVGCFILIATAFFQKFIGRAGDSLYDWLFK